MLNGTQAEDDSDETGSDDQSAGIQAPSVMEEDGDHDSAPDLDASMEDLDEGAVGGREALDAVPRLSQNEGDRR